MGMLRDAMVRKYNLDRKHEVIIKELDEKLSVRMDLNKYTDNFKTVKGTGEPEQKPRKSCSVTSRLKAISTASVDSKLV